ncbi:DUF5320 family protein [bacterium]|nr:DUF5320 family protein [bacterium]
MPGLNRKGPEGKGPRTGRGRGRCNGEESKEQETSETEFWPGRVRNRRRGMGRGLGRGQGAGMGRGYGRRTIVESEDR